MPSTSRITAGTTVANVRKPFQIRHFRRITEPPEPLGRGSAWQVAVLQSDNASRNGAAVLHFGNTKNPPHDSCHRKLLRQFALHFGEGKGKFSVG
ncbi:MAG: hypothetical protein K8T91_17200 [Planctomycetes bacterium]|nr:hypothetical protein [Planctomycetota bacterium]